MSYCRRIRGAGDETTFLDPTTSVLAQDQLDMAEMDKLLKRNVAQLEKLTESTGMPMIQENGQRRFGPPLGSKPPPKGCEVFVGKLPKFMNESHIYDVFSRAGRIYQIRLMLDFSGANRGFCFVQYHRPEEAQIAIDSLNHFKILQGRRIGVTESVDNCRLFVGGLPKDKTENDIFEELSRVTNNLVKVFARPMKYPCKDRNRGFAFAEYSSHRDAAMARRKMIPGKIPLWGKVMHIDWAEPDQPETVNRNYGLRADIKNRGKYFHDFNFKAFQEPMMPIPIPLTVPNFPMFQPQFENYEQLPFPNFPMFQPQFENYEQLPFPNFPMFQPQFENYEELPLPNFPMFQPQFENYEELPYYAVY